MVTLPWLIAEAEDTMALMGHDFWAYGIPENLHDITHGAREVPYEQGLIERKVMVEERFLPPDVRDLEGVMDFKNADCAHLLDVIGRVGNDPQDSR